MTGSIIAGPAFMSEEMVIGTIQRMAGFIYPVIGRLVQGVVHGYADIGNDVIVK